MLYTLSVPFGGFQRDVYLFAGVSADETADAVSQRRPITFPLPQQFQDLRLRAAVAGCGGFLSGIGLHCLARLRRRCAPG